MGGGGEYDNVSFPPAVSLCADHLVRLRGVGGGEYDNVSFPPQSVCVQINW